MNNQSQFTRQRRWRLAVTLLLLIVTNVVLVSGRNASAERFFNVSAAMPSISITAPANGSSFAAPATFTLEAAPGAGSSAIVGVEFFNCTTSLGTGATAPFTRQVANLGAGVYSFYARATTSGGLSATSTPITVTVTAETAAGVDWETRDVTIKNNVLSNASNADMMVDVNDNPCGGAGPLCNDTEAMVAALDAND